MQKKNRKLDKEELDLWKDITKNDIRNILVVYTPQSKITLHQTSMISNKKHCNLMPKHALDYPKHGGTVSIFIGTHLYP